MRFSKQVVVLPVEKYKSLLKSKEQEGPPSGVTPSAAAPAPAPAPAAAATPETAQPSRKQMEEEKEEEEEQEGEDKEREQKQDEKEQEETASEPGEGLPHVHRRRGMALMHYLPLDRHPEHGDTVLPDGHVMTGARLRDVLLHTQDDAAVKPKGSHRLYGALVNSDLPLSLVGNTRLRRRLETLRETAHPTESGDLQTEKKQKKRRRGRRPWIHLH